MRKCKQYIVFSIFFVIISCDNNDNLIVEEEHNYPCLKTFSFLKENNSCLNEESVYIINSEDSTIRLFIPNLESFDSLVASFTGSYTTVEVGGRVQESGVTKNDFNESVIYDVTGKNGKKRQYMVYITGLNDIPRFDIITDNKQPIVSKANYVEATLKVSNSPDKIGKVNTRTKIKGRGNATWRNYPKKPYKIKFDRAIPLLGSKNKDYVLLAEYCDRSLLRTAYLATVSERLEMPYTIKYQHIDLYINDEYQGVYVLTDQVEKAKDRVNIENDGFLFENDRYWSEEALCFISKEKIHYTFKYPNTEKGDILEGDENYNYIKDCIDTFEDRLLKGESLNDIIDYETFSKWYICNELMGNMDTNIFYVIPSRNDKIYMYPVWDSEWSLGLAVLNQEETQWLLDPSLVSSSMRIWDNKLYFPYLMKDNLFRIKLKDIWIKYKGDLSHVNDIMRKKANEIYYAQQANFVRWQIMGKKVSVELFIANSYDEEIKYICDYYDNRYKWMDTFFSSL